MKEKFSSRKVKIFISSDRIGEVNISVFRRKKQPLLFISAHSSDMLFEARKQTSQLLGELSVCSKHWFLKAMNKKVNNV